MVMAGAAHDAWLLLPLVSIPLAIRVYARIARSEGAALNPLLGETARLLAVFGALLAIGSRPLG